MSHPSGNCTPTRTMKKKVSFADTAGLELATVKTIPSSNGELEEAVLNFTTSDTNCGLHMYSIRRKMKYLSPSFVQPCKTDAFLERVFSENVSLESLSCCDSIIIGVIRVTNLCYAKEVTVRFTLDQWASYRDVWADYVCANMDGKTEQFSFRMALPMELEVDLEIEFAIRYRAAQQEFWDNNFGTNYHIRCIEISQ